MTDAGDLGDLQTYHSDADVSLFCSFVYLERERENSQVLRTRRR